MNDEDKTQETISAAARPDGGGAAGAPTRRWLVLVLVCTAQFLVVLNYTIINIALPSIQRGLGFSGASLA